MYRLPQNGSPRLSYILESPRNYDSRSGFRGDVEAVSKLGFPGVELQMRTPDDIRCAELTALLGDCALRLAAIQTGSAYLEAGLSLSNPDGRVRQAAADLLKRYIDFASAFGAVVVFGLLQGSRRDEPDRELALSRILDSLSGVAAHAEAAGVLVAMEPVNRYECSVFHNTVEDVVCSVRRLASPAIRAMVDTFHVNIEESGQREAIQAAEPFLSHVHLSETNRGLFGSGHLDLAVVFAALREAEYRGFVSVGVYREQPAVAERARHSIESLRSFCNGVHA